MLKTVGIALTVVAMMTALTNADFIVESRSGGLNFGNYYELGGFANSTGKSTAPGLSPVSLGSRYSSTGTYFGPTRQAVFTYTPDVTGPYDVFVTWCTTAGHDNVTVTLFTGAENPNGNGPEDFIAQVSMNQHSGSTTTLPNVWNLLGTGGYQLTAGTTYKVSMFAPTAQLNTPGNRVASDAVKWVAVPEPATIVLLALAGLFHRRRVA